MLIQLQKSLIDSIRQYANIEQQQKPTDDTIGMIVGLTIAVILIVCFFIYLAYFLPWWSFYNLICAKCLDLSDCFDCILCYYLCPCMETKAFRYQMQQNKTNGNKVFVQDLLTTPDGCIIHLSDIRSMKQQKRFGGSEQSGSKTNNRFDESYVI